MSEMQELDPLKTGAVTWTVQVDRHGWFYADAPGFTQISAETLAKVEAQCKVKASQARVKVSVPYVRFGRSLNGWRAVHGEATGIHAGNGRVLTREDGKPGEPLSGYGSDGAYPPMDAADEARVVEIRNQELALAAEQKGILAKYKWGAGRYGGIKETVQKAVDEAAAGLGQDKGEGS
jgi:hypothetical protein